MSPGRKRSISFPIILGVFTVVLSLALLVGWILVLVQNLSLDEGASPTAWLLPLGSTSFVVIIAVLVLFSVFLVREIRMVNRQSRFIDSVTHELKSPLASLKLCLETLARTDLPETRRDEVRRMMIDDVERLTVFIDDVLEASRLTSHEKGYALDDVRLHDLVEHCAESVLGYHKQASATIRNDVPRDLVLSTDRTVLETVIKNLLDNAVKYSLDHEGRAAEVKVGTHIDTRFLHIDVTDRGVGIPRTQIKRVFERFYRVPDEAVRSRHGTGLGLYVAASLVRVLGGKLHAASDGPGSGTTMHIRLPATRNQVRSIPLTDGPAPAPQGATS